MAISLFYKILLFFLFIWCGLSFQFGDRDPVIRAIDCQQEKIACYLVEKNFPTHIYYDVSMASGITIESNITDDGHGTQSRITCLRSQTSVKPMIQFVIKQQ